MASLVQEVVLGVDVGTSRLKAGVFTLDGRLLALEAVRYGLASPEARAQEQDPDAWWAALASASRAVLARAGQPVRVAAVGIGGQAPTFVASDAHLRPTHPAVTWLDGRPAATAEDLYARLGQPVPVWGSWPAQAAWFSRERRRELGRSRWFFDCASYLTARLSGVPVMADYVSDAELDAGALDGRRLPPRVAPGQLIGGVQAAAAEATGLPAATPVVNGYIDGVLGVLGSGARRPGQGCMNGGTSGTFSVVCAPPLGFAMLGLRILGGAAATTSGSALDWFVRNLAGGSDYAPLLDEVGSIVAGADGLLFVPTLAGERSPLVEPDARGAWIGLTLEHDRRHLLRALLEGVAYGFRTLQCSVQAHGADVDDVRSVGGQARSALWNQIKSDVLGRPVLVPAVTEASLMGAAILAARGIGAFATVEQAVDGMVSIAQRFQPDPVRARLHDDLFAIFNLLQPALAQTSSRLASAAAVARQAQASIRP
ncbi:MAG: FGGY-family carbohydrate kinase [Chloroflexota bacterium]|nr:FGGY-family carbohydrate kinase [Chloroflexota bacterium]